MAQRPNRRLDPQTLLSDRAAFTAVEAMANYMPLNQSFARERLSNLCSTVDAARRAEIHAQNALDAARDAANAAEWEFHDAVLGAKTQVIAQYGPDSNEVQALGLKKKSERKKASGRPKVSTS